MPPHAKSLTEYCSPPQTEDDLRIQEPGGGTADSEGVEIRLFLSVNTPFLATLWRRPVGRPSHKPAVRYKGFLYRAASWKTARRVVAKVKFHVGELFPRAGLIVTNLSLPSRAIVRFYEASVHVRLVGYKAFVLSEEVKISAQVLRPNVMKPPIVEKN